MIRGDMAIARIFPVLLLAVITRCRSDQISGYTTHSGSSSHFGSLLKPPPPPPLPPIVPVPFHGGEDRTQRHNVDVGYQYQAPPPPLSPSSEFKFPAPFYKQYNFNFVPPPQPFSTTASPNIFQKVSGWLFPSQQTSYVDSTLFNNNVAPVKKDCNPCNLVPWLPVIRYNLGAKSVYQNSLPTYGPPSPTAYADFVKILHNQPQPFNSPSTPQLSPGESHINHGPQASSFNTNAINAISSTYGPPSATHSLDVVPNPPTSTFSQPSTSYGNPSSSYVLSSNSFDSQYLSTPANKIPNNLYNVQSSTYRTPSSSYGTPSPVYETQRPLTTTFQPVTPLYEPVKFNKELPKQSDLDYFDNITPTTQQQLPKVSYPSVFKNSYGEPITNTQLFDISYHISATAAESSKVKTQVLPHESEKAATPNNTSFALANPAPFTLNRGRNIHTLQPVALPNLSVSPLPPIFNARPFRPISLQFPKNILQGINQMQQFSNSVNIEQSIPLAEFTHSVDYPATVIQSPIIEISPPSISNQTKGYRNIANSYVVDEIKDISSQASEDHVSATKSDSSFESIGTEVGNDLYDGGIPPDFKPIPKLPLNHKLNFADLRGANDDDVDKYRTESNLQHIDSPLLYLKPSAPHKNHGNFILAVSSSIPNNENEYEIYDDIPTTTASQTSSWDESRTDYNEETPSVQGNAYKPKIVQIIVPYTTGNKDNKYTSDDFVHISEDWPSTPKDEYQARKVPSYADKSHITADTENYNTMSTTTEHSIKDAENYDSEQTSIVDTEKDFYDVKEPPFDIIKLQHNIDDWTEQEYSKQYNTPQKTRSSEKYAKQIPDDFFTTTVPSNYVTTTNNYNYDFYDHEGSSSVHHTVTDERNNTFDRPRKEYNTIERTKNKYTSDKNEEPSDVQRLHIYTAASSFRSSSSTTTPAPWGKIQTSISPLTQEKVYVVTSKPWRDSHNISKEWYDVEAFESKKTNHDSRGILPFKSPRFLHRPSFGFTSGGKIEADSSYGYSKSWYQSINELETLRDNNSTSLLGTREQKNYTETDKDSTQPQDGTGR